MSVLVAWSALERMGPGRKYRLAGKVSLTLFGQGILDSLEPGVPGVLVGYLEPGLKGEEMSQNKVSRLWGLVRGSGCWGLREMLPTLQKHC